MKPPVINAQLAAGLRPRFLEHLIDVGKLIVKLPALDASDQMRLDPRPDLRSGDAVDVIVPFLLGYSVFHKKYCPSKAALFIARCGPDSDGLSVDQPVRQFLSRCPDDPRQLLSGVEDSPFDRAEREREDRRQLLVTQPLDETQKNEIPLRWV